MARAARVDTVDSPMLYRNGRYEIDWDDLESKMTADVRATIVCNPQNPTGNVWTEEELLRLGRLALEHKVVVLADEIHSDVIRAGHRYTPFASLPDEAVVNNSVSFNAVSKTFNLAAMKNAYYYSKSRTLLARVNQYHRAELSTLGVVANTAAYRDGGEWFDQANAYMDDNHTFVESYVKQHMPDVGYTRNEGTFMTFLDFSRVMERIGAEEMTAKGGGTARGVLPGLADPPVGCLSESRFQLRQRRRRPHANERGLVPPGTARGVRGDGRGSSQRLARTVGRAPQETARAR